MSINLPEDPAPERADASTAHVLTESSLTTRTSVPKEKREKEDARDIQLSGSERVETPSDFTSKDQRSGEEPQSHGQNAATAEQSTVSESRSPEEDPLPQGFQVQVLENSDTAEIAVTNTPAKSKDEAETRESNPSEEPPGLILLPTGPEHVLSTSRDINGEVSVATLDEPKPLSRPQSWHHALATDILDKQYRLYSWNDSKSLSLITTNSVLLAAIGFLFKECIPDLFSLLAILIALAFVACSLYFSLKQVIPQGSSGKSGKGPNVRALRSITEFKKWEDYHSKLLSMDENEAFECAARQVYGMAINNDASRRTTTRGVKLTFAGIVLILVATVGVGLSAREIHLLGQWVRTSAEMKPSVEKPLNASTNPTEGSAAPSNNPTPIPSPSASRPNPRKQSKNQVSKEN
ncbi:MAG: hypothetical protein QOE96_3771 [Blastocatellia bacterium]|jgi:hypothetical protein|nr:hypothetical protein [Blastocatellia bacterium]